MKLLLLLPPAWLVLSFSGNRCLSLDPHSSIKSDSSIIEHKLDGKVDEWPAEKFSSDNGTGIQYAMDNNGSNLFLALNIPDFRTQIKMMRMGMSMYIDEKGKKKESHGIEFPVKNDNSDQGISGLRQNRQNADQTVNEQQRKENIKAIRRLLALNLVEIKIFGLSDKYPDGQQLMLPGSANIAFNWDTSDVMHIEYLIPLSMLGDISSLNQKEINIGWKIHAFEMPKEKEGSEGSEDPSIENQPSGSGRYGGGRGSGYGGGGGHRSGAYGGSADSQADREKLMGEQKFRAKYTIHLPAEKKAF